LFGGKQSDDKLTTASYQDDKTAAGGNQASQPCTSDGAGHLTECELAYAEAAGRRDFAIKVARRRRRGVWLGLARNDEHSGVRIESESMNIEVSNTRVGHTRSNDGWPRKRGADWKIKLSVMKIGLALSGPTPVTISVTTPLVKEPVMFVTKSPPGPVVAVSVPLPVKGEPPREGDGPVADQLKVMDSALAGSIGAVRERANPVKSTKAPMSFACASH
jgi:hypothetical protein